MTELTKDLSLDQTLSLINSYAFDSGGNSAEELLKYWLNIYHASWIRLATIEALYLGRYKTVSIEQILSVWLRLGNPNTHFTYEFERLICRKLPKHLSNLSDLTTTVTPTDMTVDSNLMESQTHSEVLATGFTGVAGHFNEVRVSQGAEVQGCLVPSNASSVLLQRDSCGGEALAVVRHLRWAGSPEISKVPKGFPRDSRGVSRNAPTVEPTRRGLSDPSEIKQAVAITVDLAGLESATKAQKVTSSLNQESRMSLISALGLSYTPNWSEFTGAKMIHQFIPIPDVSSFFNKLRAFAEEKLEGP